MRLQDTSVLQRVEQALSHGLSSVSPLLRFNKHFTISYTFYCLFWTCAYQPLAKRRNPQTRCKFPLPLLGPSLGISAASTQRRKQMNPLGLMTQGGLPKAHASSLVPAPQRAVCGLSLLVDQLVHWRHITTPNHLINTLQREGMG